MFGHQRWEDNQSGQIDRCNFPRQAWQYPPNQQSTALDGSLSSIERRVRRIVSLAYSWDGLGSISS